VAYLVAGMALGCTFVALAAWGGRRAGERVRRWVELVSGVALGGFALRLLWDTVARAHRWLAPALRALA
jgi:threonine/homoserine/homoserine lactone efflux protein